MTFIKMAVLAVCVVAVEALPAGQAARREPVVGLPCEGCELVFESMPASIGPVSRIAPADEPGEPMRIEGVVRNAGGKAISGVIVYAYHTNAKGLYPNEGQRNGQSATRHGWLRAWAKTDANGRYRFDTIRPGGYPGTNIQQHVHMHIIEPGRCTYYIDEMVFTDDPRLTPEARRNVSEGRGGSAVVTPKRDSSGTWLVTRDIVLGAGIPGYPR